jgi:hypothetical protein
MTRLGRIGFSAVALMLTVLLGLWWLGRGALGRHDSEILEPVPVARSAASVASGAARQRAAAEGVGAAGRDRQILFGDLHVHTTISFDAFMLNLPVLGGSGATPPADACDFARHCAALDVWSINDHAANITPRDWRNTIESVRQCNAMAGGADDPDMVSFLGWEWTQAGRTPEDHYGHKNVVLAHTDADRIPARPIAASHGGVAADPPPTLARGALALGDPRFRDLAARWTAISGLAVCPDGDVRELPDDCREIAPNPAELFRKLDEWGHDALVIPHGTTWGVYTPPTASWDHQLVGAMHDPERQTLIEIYSGHGSSEVYRDWRAVELGADGEASCPDSRPDFLPMCQRAGQIILERCLDEGTATEECEARAQRARRYAAAAGVSPQITVPGTDGADWLDAGQCRDCGQPAFSHRPASSAQYIAALGDFSGGGARPRRFRMGFIASSDIHTAKPGTGYKELRALSETRDLRRPSGDGIASRFFRAPPEAPGSRPRSYAEAAARLSGLQLYETERTRSFLYTGGLVAVHSEGRDRASIWSALARKEAYGTSGPRMLLWFDLLSEAGAHPMGSEVATREAPIFRVRAVGSFEQAPGCPESTRVALGAERTADLCAGECYRPTDERRPIRRIEVVRIRPQASPAEDIGSLVDDPWQRFECPADPGGCVATFIDPEFTTAGRDAVYYARAFEARTPTVNGDPARCTWDAEGRCIETQLCVEGSDCLDPYAPRAWSSPIYVDFER